MGPTSLALDVIDSTSELLIEATPRAILCIPFRHRHSQIPCRKMGRYGGRPVDAPWSSHIQDICLPLHASLSKVLNIVTVPVAIRWTQQNRWTTGHRPKICTDHTGYREDAIFLRHPIIPYEIPTVSAGAFHQIWVACRRKECCSEHFIFHIGSRSEISTVSIKMIPKFRRLKIWHSLNHSGYPSTSLLSISPL
jgi:hypothetical protein